MTNNHQRGSTVDSAIEISDSEADSELEDVRSISSESSDEIASDHSLGDDYLIEAGDSDDGFDFDGDSSTDFQAQDDQFRQELNKVKIAGFKVSPLREVGGGGRHISVACRISKLDISEDTLSAWSLQPQQYIVLVIKYLNGYKDLGSLVRERSRVNVEMYVGSCGHYKPSATSVMRAIMKTGTSEYVDSKKPDHVANADSTRDLKPIFISGSLNELLAKRFLHILFYRIERGHSWLTAEAEYDREDNNKQNLNYESLPDTETVADVKEALLPDLVKDDHLHGINGADAAFPLVAMQFVLRHLVLCTDYCLVCFREVSGESLKPYVCEKPLCLFQYNQLGFGTSIEQELIHHPYVVDLLVSFCYSAARGNAITTFPLGLNIQVPSFETQWARFDRQRFLLRLDSTAKREDYRTGDWLCLSKTTGTGSQEPPVFPPSHMLHSGRNIDTDLLYDHCRIVDVTNWPTLVLGFPGAEVDPNRSLGRMKDWQDDSSSTEDVNVRRYSTMLDDVTDHQRCAAINLLLDALPSVGQMKRILENSPNVLQLSILSSRNAIPPSSIQILRWIIYSNRACILQDGGADADGKFWIRPDDNVYGVPGHLQFRFAMGAPDKERRFVDAINEVMSKNEMVYPTRFAWHGSHLTNWHSIIREGLHFRQTVNGRSYGHGVYMSHNWRISEGYLHSYRSHIPGGLSGWKSSELHIENAMSLQEVVNSPDDYVHQDVHFVVDKVDWIQTRYLFVKLRAVPGTESPLPVEVKPTRSITQDPNKPPSGPSEQLIIPVNAVNYSRQFKTVKWNTNSHKRAKSTGTKLQIEHEIPDDVSIKTTASDLDFLLDRSASEVPSPSGRYANCHIINDVLVEPGKTDYQPGQSDLSKLALTQSPTYSSISASKALQREYRQMFNLQKELPAHELGFTVRTEIISESGNFYQWLVDFHSFAPHLPLAKQMSTNNITSIVMEVNFNSRFPLAPPFIRVITPRFLDFAHGGGGNITAGGAICMELLTESGWTPANSMESVLVQVRTAMCDEERPAQLANGPLRQYGIGEAVDAYFRAARAHKWAASKDVEVFRHR